MFKERKLLSSIILSIISMLLFSRIAFAVHIEIRPVLEKKEYYIMKVGQIQAFEARGFGWDNATSQDIPDVEIKEIKWTFDERFLQLQDMKGNSITLKLIKARTSRLTTTGEVEGKTVTKTIFIVPENKH